MKVFSVSGANYGDEGKGHIVSYLASKYGGTVIRYSGGAQAGHTVVRPDGLRHVFHHFGAGTLTGNPTFLTEDFIVNPMVYRREHEELLEKGIKPVVSCSKWCNVTLPYDMAINQELEKFRGDGNHGSVGLGIFETLERAKKFASLDVSMDSGDLAKRMIRARDNYYFPRARHLGLSIENHPAFSEATLNRFIDDFDFFKSTLSGYGLPKDNCYIFEGSQGLLLDPDYGVMPHCSPGSFGIKNIKKSLRNVSIAGIQAIYATRSYVTRHGAGPMQNECDLNLVGTDKTNVDHRFQGRLRYGKLDADALRKVAEMDFRKYSKPCDSLSYAVTCVDQYDDGEWKKLNPDFVSFGENFGNVLE